MVARKEIGAPKYKQDAPFCVQVELTLGCNLGCAFCGINGIGYQKGKSGFKYMTPETAYKVAKSIADSGWNSRIEFARRGEPTLNPDMVNIVGIFRRMLPKASIMMTANGGGLLQGLGPRKKIPALFDAGLNTLALDDYEPLKLVTKIVGKLDSTLLRENNITRYNYPEDPRGNPHKRRKPNDRHLVIIQDIKVATTGTHATINNHGGYAGPARHYDKPCAKPFREFSVNWDGTVNHCCIAWAGEMVCGNVAEERADKIWNNDRFFAVRQKLIRGQRDFGTCKGCDHPSYRVGLLPDKYGKDKDAYPPPNKKTDKILAEMEAEGYQIKPAPVFFKNKEKVK